MPKSDRPRKKRKQREKDPIKLVLSRGLNMEERWQHGEDEDGQPIKERVLTAAPKGIVLGPVQTMLLASFIQMQQQTIEMLLADDDDEDSEEETEQAEAE